MVIRDFPQIDTNSNSPDVAIDKQQFRLVHPFIFYFIQQRRGFGSKFNSAIRSLPNRPYYASRLYIT